MSKELEALEVLQNYIMVNEPLETQEHYLKRLNVIRLAITPPTAEEVCKALSEHYGKEVIYEKQFKEFRKGFRVVAHPRENIYNEFDLLGIPPHLITLIGRFYEGLENE